MVRNPFKRKIVASPEVDILSLVPIIRIESRPGAEDGLVELLDPRYKSGLLGRWLQPRLEGEKAFVIVKLDEKGSQVWRNIDGKRDISAIISDYASVFPDDPETASDRVWRFLQMSAVHGFLEFLDSGTV